MTRLATAGETLAPSRDATLKAFTSAAAEDTPIVQKRTKQTLAKSTDPGPRTLPKKRADGRGDQVQSLVRALTLLNRLADSGEGATLTELAHEVGLSSSTAHRLLTTLEQERYLHFDAVQRLWRIGVQAFVVGNAFLASRNLVAAARPHMRLLMEESGETVNLAVEEQGQAVYLSQIECRQMMRAFARPGGRVPLHCSSVGKALLATMSDGEVARVLHGQGLARLTVKTLGTAAALKDDLDRSRVRGFAIDDEEHAVGLRCIAAAIFDENAEPLAAVSVSGPVARILDERIELLGGVVKRHADAITASLGGRSSERGRSRRAGARPHLQLSK